MPRISVLIPSFNMAHFLPFALESVEKQTFNDWEILLVDDGSTDDTRQVAERLRERLGSRLHYIYQENAGLSATRNAAIAASSGEFLALLDADDIWFPQRLEAELPLMRADSNVGIVHASVVLIDAAGKRMARQWPHPRHHTGNIAKHIYMRTASIACPTVLFRRCCIEQVGLFDTSLTASEDRDLWLRIALHYRVAYVPEALAYYRRSASSVSADQERMFRNQIRFIEKHSGCPGCGPPERRRALAQCYAQRAGGYERRGRYSHALKDRMRAMTLSPWDVRYAYATARLLASFARPRRHPA